MKNEKMYEGMIVIENFTLWNEFYSKNKIPISELPEAEYYENMGVILKCDDPKAKEHAIIKNGYLIPIKNYSPLKVKAANTEQSFALELLRDDSIPLVTLFGAAGSGKTYLACAHMLHYLNKGLVNKIIICKNMTPVR